MISGMAELIFIICKEPKKTVTSWKGKVGSLVNVRIACVVFVQLHVLME